MFDIKFYKKVASILDQATLTELAKFWGISYRQLQYHATKGKLVDPNKLTLEHAHKLLAIAYKHVEAKRKKDTE